MKMGRMSWIMMAGCGLMLAAVFLLPVLGVQLGGVVPLLIVIICPLSHLLMMGTMRKGQGHTEHRPGAAGDYMEHQTTTSAAIAPPAPRERG